MGKNVFSFIASKVKISPMSTYQGKEALNSELAQGQKRESRT